MRLVPHGNFIAPRLFFAKMKIPHSWGQVPRRHPATGVEPVLMYDFIDFSMLSLRYKCRKLKVVHEFFLRSYIMGFHVAHDSDTGVYIHLSLNTNCPLQRKPEEVRFGKIKSRFP